MLEIEGCPVLSFTIWWKSGCMLIRVKEGSDGHNGARANGTMPWVCHTLHCLEYVELSSSQNHYNWRSTYQMIDDTGCCNVLGYCLEKFIPYSLHNLHKLQRGNCPMAAVSTDVIDQSWNKLTMPNCDISSLREITIFDTARGISGCQSGTISRCGQRGTGQWCLRSWLRSLLFSKRSKRSSLSAGWMVTPFDTYKMLQHV